MAYTYALINKETLAYICGKKGISNNFISDRTKLNADKVALWLDSSDQALPTIKQATIIHNVMSIDLIKRSRQHKRVDKKHCSVKASCY